MIDLHSHILPGIDDGASDLETALEMARIAVDDGIEVMACTPHFLPGVYDLEAQDVRQRVAVLNEELWDRDINLALAVGCEAHVRPDFVSRLADGRILRIHDSHFVLIEAPFQFMPPHLEDLLCSVMNSGYIPVLAHPERLRWVENKFEMIGRLVKAGLWTQVTAGALTGEYGKHAEMMAREMMARRLVHIVASDAHDTARRRPCLSRAREIVRMELGSEEAERAFVSRPQQILFDDVKNGPQDTPKGPATGVAGHGEGTNRN